MGYVPSIIDQLTIFFKLFWGVMQMMVATFHIGRLRGPVVSIFGGARVPEDMGYIDKAHKLAHLLVASKIAVLTGGGPGIMEAANCGALHESGTSNMSFGIRITGLKDEEEENPCLQRSMDVEYFFVRKWILLQNAVGFVIFPGGYGTLDELFELLTLVQTGKLQQAPIILIGKSYWELIIEFLQKTALAHKMLDPDALKILTVTDDVEYACAILKKHCESLVRQ